MPAAAGWAVSSRGIGAICIMPIIGMLAGRIDNRLLIITGFVLFGVTSLWMGGLTLDISPTSLVLPIVFSGMASGMVFVPLSTISVGTLKNEQIGNAAGLFNLMRNVGGGVGISMVNTLVARHVQTHRAELVGNMSPGTPAFENALKATQGAMSHFAPPNIAAQRAYGLLQGTLEVQAAAFSYVDVFRDLALACFACGLVVLLMKRVKSRKGAASVGH